MKLAFRAFDKTGFEVADVIDAADATEAAEKLRHQELFVAEISPLHGRAPGAPRRRLLPAGASRRLKNLAMFTRQLFVLVRSGTTLAQALQALERQAADASWRDVILDVRAELEHGAPLSEAMEGHPEYFDTVYRNMIAAGESSGKLPEVLDRLAMLTRKRLHVRNSVRAALVYPCLLSVVAVAVLTIMMLVVIPRFAELFDSLDVPVPPTTAMLVCLSGMLRAYWWAVIAAVAGVVAGTKLYFRTPSGKRLWDTVVLRIPQIGQVVRSFASAHMARLLGILLDSHLHILEALRLTRGSMRNVHYQALLTRAEAAVARGDPISTAFQASDLISPSVYEATRSGEQSGQVNSLLLDLADFLDEENEVTLRSLTSIIEPVILIVMGALVAFVAISIFTPLFDVTDLAGGGPR